MNLNQKIGNITVTSRIKLFGSNFFLYFTEQLKVRKVYQERFVKNFSLSICNKYDKNIEVEIKLPEEFIKKTDNTFFKNIVKMEKVLNFEELLTFIKQRKKINTCLKQLLKFINKYHNGTKQKTINSYC